jgi:Ni/Co efflux regulator RcnB
MKKLVSLLVAAIFAVSSGFAVAASHAGAQPMKKDEMKKDEGKDGKKAAKKGDKKSAKKGDKKSAKKDDKK